MKKEWENQAKKETKKILEGNKMHENEIKKETKNNEKLDSISIGTPTKGAVKVYLDLNTLTDDEAKSLVKRAVGLHKYLMGLNQ